MRLYKIFNVKSQYEYFTMGREEQLFYLLREFEKNKQQVEYICNPIQPLLLEKLMQKLSIIFHSSRTEKGHCELIHPVKGKITITAAPYYLSVYCEGSRMLDLDLFNTLSKEQQPLFAVMQKEKEWGWLKPIKYTKENDESAIVFH